MLHVLYGCFSLKNTILRGDMIRSLLLFLFALFFQSGVFAGEPILLKRDNDSPVGYHTNMPAGTEESATLEPKASCLVEELRIYIGGSYKGADTVYIVDDPAEGAIPPTHWVWRYAVKARFIYQHDGVPKWYTFKVTDSLPLGLQLGGFDRLVIQHRTKQGGPYFATDNAQTQPYGSFLMNPNVNNSLGGPGVYYLASGDFLVRALINYNITNATNYTTAPAAPYPSLYDATISAGLTSAEGRKIANALVSVADWDMDGDDDVAIGANFFKNNGNATFTNVTSGMGVAGGNQVFVDMDGDGDMDVFSVRGMGNDKLYRNDAGVFTDISAQSGIVNNAPTVAALWFDYNKDGLSDVFLANGRTESNGQEVYYQDKLFKNTGGGVFTDVTAESGIAASEISPFQDCWSASLCDYNNDGRTDILVNTYRLAPDKLYKNNGDGTFTDVGEETGIRGNATDAEGYFGHGMGSDWADIDNDGDLDVVIGNLGHPDWRGGVSNPSLIYVNSGAPDYIFRDATREAGLKFFEMNSGTVWADLNQDGFQDLWHSQYAYESAGSNGAPARLGRMYLGHGAINNVVQPFSDKTWEYGAKIHGGWGAVRLDYDNDGDMDLLIASQYDGVTLLRNDIQKANGGDWLCIRLKNDRNSRPTISTEMFGSIITVYTGGIAITRQLSGTVNTARTSQATNELHFGLGDMNAKADSIVIALPNGEKKIFNNVELNKKYTVSAEGLTALPIKIAPQLNEPANGGKYNTHFRWLKISGATGYELQYSTTQDFSANVINQIIENAVQLAAILQQNETFFWRVRTLYGTEQSDWSAAWLCINGNAKPDGVPTLLLPIKKAQKVTLKPTLKWTKVGYKGGLNFVTDYKVELSSKSDFSIIVWDTLVKELSEIKTPALPSGTTIWWRIAAVNNGTFGEWSESGWYFSTIAKPGNSTVLEPMHEAKNIDRRPTFLWNATTEAETYDLQVSEMEDFSVTDVNNSTITDTIRRITKNLQYNTKYWWRMRGINEAGIGDWSAPRTFTTIGATGIEDIHHDFYISVYPNPAFDIVALSVMSNICTTIGINIINVHGEQVFSSDKEICSGEYEFTFNTEHWSSGLYNVHIRYHDRIEQIPIQIIK